MQLAQILPALSLIMELTTEQNCTNKGHNLKQLNAQNLLWSG